MFKTQIELAREGVLTDIMKAVAAKENLPDELIRHR
jgi:thiamine biosynthesis protein ThiC